MQKARMRSTLSHFKKDEESQYRSVEATKRREELQIKKIYSI